MKKLLLYSLATIALATSCSKAKYHVEGEITNAKDSILYFENLSLEGPVVMDSVKLAEDGKFQFAADAKEAPEFYRLRIADQIINLSADSTETVSVKAQYPDMAWKYDAQAPKTARRYRNWHTSR